MSIPARGDLLALLADIPDPRGRKGRRHQLPAMLAAIVCGILAGAQGCTAISQWIHNQEAPFWHRLGFLRRPPTINGFRYLLLKLPPETLESVIRQWVTEVLEIKGLRLPDDQGRVPVCSVLRQRRCRQPGCRRLCRSARSVPGRRGGPPRRGSARLRRPQ